MLTKMLEDERYAGVLRMESAKVAFSAKPRDYEADGKEAANSDEFFVYFLKLIAKKMLLCLLKTRTSFLMPV